MKYLRKFNTEADVMMFDSPNVVLVADTKNVLYNVPKPKGVYIQHIDGTLYDEDAWTNGGFSNDVANGVAVIAEKASFVIAKNDWSKKKWSSKVSGVVNGILTTTDSATAITDFAGYDNTQLMLATDTSGAAYSCANFTFPNGDKGYLPALGEWQEAYDNKSKIDSLMTKIGGAALQSDLYWSSTQYNSTTAWSLRWSNGSTFNPDKNYANGCVRAFSALPL